MPISLSLDAVPTTITCTFLIIHLFFKIVLHVYWYPFTRNSNQWLQIDYSAWHQICCSCRKYPPIHFSFAPVLSCSCACCFVLSLSRPEHTGNDAKTPDAHSEAALQPMYRKRWALMISLSSSPAARMSDISISLLSYFFIFFIIELFRNCFWFLPDGGIQECYPGP